jgi:integrase
MASVKVKFRVSTVENKPGSIYFQIIQNRMVRQLNTDYKIYADEWDEKSESIIAKGQRTNLLASIKECLDWDIVRLNRVVKTLENEHHRYSADDVITAFLKLTKEVSLCSFMHKVIAQLKQLGKERTSETYTVALKSFMRFRNEQDIPLDGISSDLIQMYEAWLRAREVRMNTISFYMRILRAVYNRAVEKGLVEQKEPFRHVYTGIEKTRKRAISLKEVKKLKNLDLSRKPSLEFARDIFLFSFYTRGMSFIDIAYLRKSDLSNGILTYHRRKTGQLLTIRWENCMKEIVDKYEDKNSKYLLPLLCSDGDSRKQYKNALRLVNYHLKTISKMLNIQDPITMYVARHSWASAAKQNKVPLSIISQGMGHDSEVTTQIYLASLDTSVIDKANKMILNSL